MSAPASWTTYGPASSAPLATSRDKNGSLGERIFRQVAEDRFTLEAHDVGVSFELSRLRRERGSLLGDLIVHSDLAGVATFDGVMSSGDFYLTNPRARQERARILAERAGTTAIDFHALLEELCTRVVAAERKGQPAILLRDAPRAQADGVIDVMGFPLLLRHPLILFGQGGAAKSLFLLWILGQLALQGMSVALFDWELSPEDHRDRFERLFGTDMPPLLYVRCVRPLVYEHDRLKRIVQDNGITFGGFDSVAFGCDGPPEAAEVATKYLGAVRSLGIGSMHIAHVNRSDRSDEAPFGSSFWHNGARSTWFIKAAEAVAGAPLNVGLFHKKSNLSRKMPALGYALTFSEHQTTIERVNVADVDSLAVQLPISQRARHLLRSGPLTIVEIADSLDAKPNSVEVALKRSPAFVRIVSPADGIHRYALAERRFA